MNSDNFTDTDWNWQESGPEAASKRGTRKIEDIKTGVESMLPCGLKGVLKACEVSMLEYFEGQDLPAIGIPHGLIEMKEKISVEILSENTGLYAKDDQGQTVAMLLLAQESSHALLKMKDL